MLKYSLCITSQGAILVAPDRFARAPSSAHRGDPNDRRESFDLENVFCDRDDWDYLFPDTIKNDPAAADSLARLLYETLRSLREGTSGVERTVNTLRLGLACLYPYTTAGRMSFQAFLYDLESLTPTSELPAELLRRTAERAGAAYATTGVTSPAKVRLPCNTCRKMAMSKGRGKRHANRLVLAPERHAYLAPPTARKSPAAQ